MSKSDDIYSSVKDDIWEVVEPLLEFSTRQLTKNGDFAPFGSGRTLGGEIKLYAGEIESNVSFSDEIAGAVSDGLRLDSLELGIAAFCEMARIERGSDNATDAVKVTVEHIEGLTVSYYLPYAQSNDGEYSFGEIVVVESEPVLTLWG